MRTIQNAFSDEFETAVEITLALNCSITLSSSCKNSTLYLSIKCLSNTLQIAATI